MKKIIIGSMFLGSCVWGMEIGLENVDSTGSGYDGYASAKSTESDVDRYASAPTSAFELPTFFNVFSSKNASREYKKKNKRCSCDSLAKERCKDLIALIISLHCSYKFRKTHEQLLPASYVKEFSEHAMKENLFSYNSEFDMLRLWRLFEQLELSKMQGTFALCIATKIMTENNFSNRFELFCQYNHVNYRLRDAIAKYIYLKYKKHSYIGFCSFTLDELDVWGRMQDIESGELVVGHDFYYRFSTKEV